ncbi:hypothetical protein ANN_17837 [Periplaneta americana]|uniref:Transposase n=1 Tax=Periplaneta americana TaxID=6978 RepID=A0ABQ8SVM7_PERAM|nr:hypothetical protein ANN_17837 [Periplaneta americana]
MDFPSFGQGRYRAFISHLEKIFGKNPTKTSEKTQAGNQPKWESNPHLIAAPDQQAKVLSPELLSWEKSQEYEQRPLHSEKVTVWAAVSSQGIIGLYFIHDEPGNRINVNANVYRQQVIEHFQGDLITFCELNNVGLGQQVFQQDGATTHTGHGNLTLLQELFPGRLISRGSDFPYPARSPDLSLCDAFLWGILNPSHAL